MPQWGDFNENLRNTFSGLSDYARQEKAKTDAFQMLLFKAKAEQMIKQSDPYQMALTAMMNEYTNQGKQRIIDTTGTDESGNIVGVDRNDYRLKATFGPSGPSFEREMTPQAQLRQKTTEAKEIKKAQMTEELNVKRQQYKKDLDNFLAIDDILQEARGEGIRRFGAGFKMSLKGVSQKGKLGQAVGAYDAVSKRLRVQLVRAAGDVGNINIVEQEAAEKLIPAKSDSKQTASIKRAYLTEISKAIDSQDPSLVKAVLDKLGVNYIEGKEDYSNLWE